MRAFRRFGDAGQYAFLPFALESYGPLAASAQTFLKSLGDIGAARGNISKSAFVRSVYKEVSYALQRGIGLLYAFHVEHCACIWQAAHAWLRCSSAG